MLVVDASCLYEVVADTVNASRIRTRLAADPDHVAPALIDAEVIGVIRRDAGTGQLDATAAAQAVLDLRDWPGERFSLQPLIDRVWELRATVRSWEGFYVALAEALDASLVTTDARLAAASGPRCSIEVF